MTTNKINGFDKYDVESDARTLISAERIRNDKRPKYYKTVLAELDKQVKAAEEAALVARTAKKMNGVFNKKG